MAKVHINPTVLDWAMTDAAVTVAQIEAATGRPRAVVDAWIKGTDQPNKGDLEIISKLVGRSPQFFLLPQPPSTARARVSRRTALIDADEATPAELQTYREVERLQKISRWIARGRPSAPKIPPRTKSPEQYGLIARHWLDWSTDIQRRASSKSAVFRSLRRALEDAGIIVIMREMGDTSNSPGFSLIDEVSPVIFINSAFKLASVRSFTLLHELAHLSLHNSRLHHSEDRAEERWCERFAASFLLPREDLLRYLSRGKVSTLELDDINRVRLVSNYFKVSWHAAAIRIVELGLGPRSLIVAAAQEPPEPSGPIPGMPPRTTPVLRQEEFGSEFPRLLLSGLEDDTISPLDARKFLRVNEAQLSSLSQLIAS